MNVNCGKKNAMTFIGYHTEICPEEAYQKCPEFWDREYVAKYARLWQAMKPENDVEKAILENGLMFTLLSLLSGRISGSTGTKTPRLSGRIR